MQAKDNNAKTKNNMPHKYHKEKSKTPTTTTKNIHSLHQKSAKIF